MWDQDTNLSELCLPSLINSGYLVFNGEILKDEKQICNSPEENKLLLQVHGNLVGMVLHA